MSSYMSMWGAYMTLYMTLGNQIELGCSGGWGEILVDKKGRGY